MSYLSFVLLGMVAMVICQGPVEERVGILEVKVEHVEADVKDVEDEVKDVEDEVKDVEDELKDDIEDVESLINGAETDLRIQGVRVTNAEEKVDVNVNNIAGLLTRMALLEARITTQEEENQEQKQEIDALKETNTRLQQLIGQLQEHNNIPENSNPQQQTLILSLQQHCDDIDRVNAEQEATIAHQETIIAQLQETNVMQGTLIHQLGDDIMLLQSGNQSRNRSTRSPTAPVPWTACTSSPCQKGGTCVDVNVDTFICLCRNGFFGVNCEQSYQNTSFLATFDSHPVTSVEDPIVFNHDILNPGGHYSKITGIYTVPMDGIYHFTVHYTNWANNHSGAHIEVDNVKVAYLKADDDAYQFHMSELNILLKLRVGQQVNVSPYGINRICGAKGNAHLESWFSGHLVYAL